MPGVAPYQQPGSQKTKALETEVNQVVDIMRENVNKVMDRGEKLNTLQGKTDDLQQSSMQFKRGASRVRKQMWWKEMKVKVIIGLVILVILVIIIAPIVATNSSNTSSGEQPSQ